MEDDLNTMAPIRIADVEVAQKEILLVARKLADNGDLMLKGSGNDEFL